METRSISGTHRIFLLLLLVPIILWVTGPAPASAHAELLRSDPASGALLDKAPSEIDLFLSESVSLGFSGVQLYDRSRTEIKLGPLTTVNGDQDSMVAPIPQTLLPGTYTVVWRALSGTDGHLSAGTYAFRVRGGSAADTSEPIVPIEPPDTGPAIATGTGFDNADPFRWLVRALTLALAVLLLGGAIFTVLVIEPTAAEIENGQPEANVAPVASRNFARMGTFAAAALFVLLILDMASQVSAIGGASFFAAFGDLNSARLIIQNTRYGFTWLLQVGGALLLVGLMLAAWRVQSRNIGWVWEIAQAAASLLFLAEALSSHGAAVSETGTTGNLPIPIITYWLHLVTAGAWIGGVMYMALALFPAFRAAGLSRDERRLFLSHAIPRFTRLAIVSVVVLGVTGVYDLVIHSVDVSAILGSAYGQLVALKVIAYAALVGVGAVNVRRITPLLRAVSSDSTAASPTESPAASLSRNVRIEVGLGIVALICAGGLTLLPPPAGGSTASASTQVAQVPTPGPTVAPATTSSTVAGYTFTLTTTPSLDGDRLVLDLQRSDPASPPLTDVAKVLFKITPQDVQAGSSSYVATPVGTPGPGKQTWQSSQSFLTLDGGYIVTAIVQRTKSEDVKAAFRLDLSEANGLKASPADVVDVLVATDPLIPVSGTVTLTLTVVDGAHRPIDGAKVTVTPSMPVHGVAQPPGVAQPVAGQPGLYTLPVDLNYGGSWLLTFTVERDGKQPIKTDASMDVVDPDVTPSPNPSASP